MYIIIYIKDRRQVFAEEEIWLGHPSDKLAHTKKLASNAAKFVRKIPSVVSKKIRKRSETNGDRGLDNIAT